MRISIYHRGLGDHGTFDVRVHVGAGDTDLEEVSIITHEGVELGLMARLARGDVQIVLDPEQRDPDAVADGDWEVNFRDDLGVGNAAGRILCLASDQREQSEVVTEIAAGAILAITRKLGPGRAGVG